MILRPFVLHTNRDSNFSRAPVPNIMTAAAAAGCIPPGKRRNRKK